MGSDQESGPDTEKPARPGRSWTERLTGSIRYRRFTDIDAGGRPSIFFKFELAPGQDDLPQGVYDILHEMKFLKRSPKDGGGEYPTRLEFNRSKKHGHVWRMPDNLNARTAADVIDAKLADLAAEIGDGPDRGR